MATPAAKIFGYDFSGALGDPWPLSWVTGNPSFSQPRLDGKGHGIGSLAMGAGTWRGKAPGYPGRSNYKADLWARWKNPGFSGGRGAGLIVRFASFGNCLVARLTSQGTSNPTLDLVKIQGGAETVLGTYSGAGLGSSVLYGGVRWRVRVEDLADGDTLVRVYTGSLGPSGDGTLRISYQGDLAFLRGLYGVGVELTTLVYNDDVKVDDLEVYDFADEWTAPAPSSATGTGWQAEIDGVLYDVTDDGLPGFVVGATGHLEGTDPPVLLESVRQGYGPTGNEASFVTVGNFDGGVLRPNSRVVVFYDGAAVFRGRVTKGKQTGSASSETQRWTCRDAFWLARDVVLEEEDGSGTRFYNVDDPESEDYDPDRQEKTIGEVLVDLFDRFTDGDYGLRFYGAAPASGTAYVLAETALLDAVLPNLAVSNNFATAVEQLVAAMPKFQTWVDPETLVWHFRDVTALSDEVVNFGSEWAEVEIEPDPSRSYTAVLYRGAKKGEAADEVLEFSSASGTLEPAWTQAQEDAWNPDKRSKAEWIGLTVLASGNYGLPLPAGVPSGTLCYVDVAASENLDPDDLRGSIAPSLDAYPRFVTGNTSTRIYLGAPLFPTPPAPGTKFTVSRLDPEAAAYLAASGVGQVYLLPPAEICPGFGGGGAAYGAGIRQGGFCGVAQVTYTKDGRTYVENIAAKVHFASALASGAGQCRPAVELAKKPLPPVGLVNYLPPPGGSPPLSGCAEGNGAPPPQVAVKFTVRKYDETVPSIRVPATGFDGDAFDAWGIERTFVFDDAEFTSQDQVAGLTPAAEALWEIYSQRTFLFSVSLGTPWRAQPDQVPVVLDGVSRWAGLFRAISLSSPFRSMPDFEAPNSFPTFEVVWRVGERKTIVRAGTASGWLALDSRALVRDIREAAIGRKIGKALQTLEDFRNRLIEKDLAVQKPSSALGDACDVQVIDQVNRRVVTVEKKFEDDQKNLSTVAASSRALEDLLMGEEKVVPGDPVVGEGVEGGYVRPGFGDVLGPAQADPRIPGGGALDDLTNAQATRYGGLRGSDDPTFGAIPGHVSRRSGVAFRTMTNANGQVVGVQGAPLAPGGAIPVGGWVTIEKPRDVLDLLGVPPERIAGKEAVVGRLVRTDDDLLEALNRKRDDEEALPVAPGTPTTSYPDGTPPDLSSYLRTEGAQKNFSVVASTWDDPGGLVFYGPTNGRADAEKFWRVMVPENVLVEVEAVAPGTGTNGGSWGWVVYGGGYRFLSDGYVVHKQAHGADFEADATQLGTPDLGGENDPGNPFGFGPCAPLFDQEFPSGIGAVLAVPNGVEGKPFFDAVVSEDPSTIAAPGTTWDFEIAWSYQASPWTAPGSAPAKGPTGPTLTADGTGTVQGRFMAPGGSVPPGLRSVSGVVRQTGGTGLAPGPGVPRTRLIGLGVELAIVEGGFLLRIAEGITIDELAGAGRIWEVENLVLEEGLVLEPQKGLDEGLLVHLEPSLELNPPVALEEALTVLDEVALLVI